MLIPCMNRERHVINLAVSNASGLLDQLRFFGQECAKLSTGTRIVVQAHSNLNHKHCKYLVD